MDDLKKRLKEEDLDDELAHLANIWSKFTFVIFGEEFYIQTEGAAMRITAIATPSQHLYGSRHGDAPTEVQIPSSFGSTDRTA